MKLKKIIEGPRFCWDRMRAKFSDRHKRRSQTYALINYVNLPVVFTDKEGLRYILYPEHNPGVYLQNDGNYEQAETAVCKAKIREGMIVFDVGTNIGLYSLLFAKLVGPSGQVHAFEPEPSNLRRLADNLALNPSLKVNLNPMAVYREPGSIQLNVYDDAFNAWHTVGTPSLPDPYHPGQFVKPLRQLKIPCTSIDQYCADKSIDHIDFLKVDVEGAELDVLSGASRMLSEKRIRLIQFEISRPQAKGMNQTGDETIEFLRRFGFKVYLIREDASLGAQFDLARIHYANFLAEAAQ